MCSLEKEGVFGSHGKYKIYFPLGKVLPPWGWKEPLIDLFQCTEEKRQGRSVLFRI